MFLPSVRTGIVPLSSELRLPIDCLRPSLHTEQGEETDLLQVNNVAITEL